MSTEFLPQIQGVLGVADATCGSNAVLQADWESGSAVIVPENIDPPAAETLARELGALAAGVAPVAGVAGAGPGAAN